jgi:hypothetical protein
MFFSHRITCISADIPNNCRHLLVASNVWWNKISFPQESFLKDNIIASQNVCIETLFRCVRKIAKATISFVMSVCVSAFNNSSPAGRFYVLLTIHHVMILDKWPMWRKILFYVFIFVFNSLHVSSTSFSSSGETNCVSTTSVRCHSVLFAVSCAIRQFTSDLHTK